MVKQEEFLWILYSFVEMTNYILGYRLIFNQKITPNKKKILIFYSMILIVNVLVLWLKLPIEKAPLAAGIGIFVPLVLLEEKRLKNTLYYPDVYIIISIVNACTMYVASLFSPLTQVQIRNNDLYCVIFDATFGLVCVGILLNQKMKKRRQEYFLELTTSQYVMLTAELISAYLIISALQYISLQEAFTQEMNELFGFFVTVVCFLFILGTSWLCISQRKNLMYQKERLLVSNYLEKQENYVKAVIEKDEVMRRFRHDVRGHLIAVTNLLKEENVEEAKEYIKILNENMQEGMQKSYTGITAVDAIIYEQLQDSEIDLVWEGNIKNVPEHIELYDLCTIFMNFMKNAVEACKELKQEKRIFVTVKRYEDKIWIIEKNPIEKEIVFSSQGYPMTDKKDKANHGFGYENMVRTIQKYDGAMKCYCKDGWYFMEILL